MFDLLGKNWINIKINPKQETSYVEWENQK